MTPRHEPRTPVVAAVDVAVTTTRDPDRLWFVAVRVTSTDGVAGFGEACDCYGCQYPGVVRSVVDELIAPEIVGTGVVAPGHTIGGIRARLRAGGAAGSPVVAACSAVEIALHDLLARTVGVPVADLFGRERDSVALYASNVTLPDGTVHDHLRTLQVPDALGVRDLKVRIIGGREDVATLAGLRRHRRTGTEMMVDANERYDGWEALRVARDLAPVGARWLEEPMPAYQRDGLRRLGRRSPIPLAYGEHCHDVGDVLEQDELLPGSILQVDASACGGIDEMRRMAHVAAGNGSRIVPHNAAGPVAFMANLHAAATTATISMMELPFPLFPAWRRLSPDAGWLIDAIVGGEIPVPGRPGLGVTMPDELFGPGITDLDAVAA
jgi:L-alanine-DL-glutamate epimerase-like enolase superfamily enzyme